MKLPYFQKFERLYSHFEPFLGLSPISNTVRSKMCVWLPLTHTLDMGAGDTACLFFLRLKILKTFCITGSSSDVLFFSDSFQDDSMISGFWLVFSSVAISITVYWSEPFTTVQCCGRPVAANLQRNYLTAGWWRILSPQNSELLECKSSKLRVSSKISKVSKVWVMSSSKINILVKVE